MPDIAGYVDRQYIKGQYYRLAASPKPVVFSGNINDLSDEDALLSKALLVTKGNVDGTLPNDFGNSFLITTVKFGNDVYLQTAYMEQTGYECWEYKRLYVNGNWTEWLGVESEIDMVSRAASAAQSAAASASSSVSSLSTDVSTLNSSVNGLKNTVNGLSSSVSAVKSDVNNISQKIAVTDVSSSYTITKSSGKWTLGETNVRKSGNCVYMSLSFNHRKNDDVDVGQNGFVGTLSAPNSLKPLFLPCLVGFWGGAIIMCEVPGDGVLQARVLAGNIHPRTDNPVPVVVTGTFMVSG